jgi:tryptophan-rich sensory protein
MATAAFQHEQPARPLSSWAVWVGLVGWLALCYAAMGVGALFPADAWYAELRKPSWTPPNWVFPVVWPVLYTLMGVSAWLVWRWAGFGGAGAALGVFLAQLAVNAAWSYLFFGLHRADLGLIDIAALWLLIGATVAAFRRHSATAAWFLAPYLLWVSYAATLNAGILRMNGA